MQLDGADFRFLPGACLLLYGTNVDNNPPYTRKNTHKKSHMIDIGSLRVCFKVVVVFICACYVALPGVQLAHGLEGEKVQ